MTQAPSIWSRRRRPLWGAFAMGLGGALVLGFVAQGLAIGLDLSDAFVSKVLVAFGLVLGLVLSFLPVDLPAGGFGLANGVTLLRGGLVALPCGFLGEPSGTTAGWLLVGIAALALALDGVDGWLARQLGSASPFGARFDLETDALLIAVLSLLAWQTGRAGAWVLLSGLLRYLFVAAGQVWVWLRRPLPPSRRRQAACVAQVASLLLCLTPAVPFPWERLAALAGLGLLVYSFGVDIVWLARHARPSPSEDQRP